MQKQEETIKKSKQSEPDESAKKTIQVATTPTKEKQPQPAKILMPISEEAQTSPVVGTLAHGHTTSPRKRRNSKLQNVPESQVPPNLELEGPVAKEDSDQKVFVRYASFPRVSSGTSSDEEGKKRPGSRERLKKEEPHAFRKKSPLPPRKVPFSQLTKSQYLYAQAPHSLCQVSPRIVGLSEQIPF